MHIRLGLHLEISHPWNHGHTNDLSLDFFNNNSNHLHMCLLSTLCGSVDKHSPFDTYIYIYTNTYTYSEAHRTGPPLDQIYHILHHMSFLQPLTQMCLSGIDQCLLFATEFIIELVYPLPWNQAGCHSTHFMVHQFIHLNVGTAHDCTQITSVRYAD